MDREVWRATDHGVAKSWTQLKGLSLLIPNIMGHSEPAESHMEEGQKAVVRWIHDTSWELSPMAREALWVLFQSLSPPTPERHGALQGATDPSAWWWGGGCCLQGCPSSRLLRACFCQEPGGKVPQSRPGRRPSAPRWSGPASWTLSAEKITGENDHIRPPANNRLPRPWSHWVTAYRKNTTLLIGLRRSEGKRKLWWKGHRLHEGPFTCVILLRNLQKEWASLAAQWWRILLPMQEMWVQSLSGKDPLEKEMATCFQYSWLGKSHGQRSLVGYSPWDCKE